MKATAPPRRREGLRVARKADFLEDLRLTVIELARYRHTSAREIKYRVSQALSEARTLSSDVRPELDGEPRSEEG